MMGVSYPSLTLRAVCCAVVLGALVIASGSADAEVRTVTLEGGNYAVSLSTGPLSPRAGAANSYSAIMAFTPSAIGGREGYVAPYFLDSNLNVFPGNQYQQFLLLDQNGRFLQPAIQGQHLYPLNAFSQPVTVRMSPGDTRGEYITLETVQPGQLGGIFPAQDPVRPPRDDFLSSLVGGNQGQQGQQGSEAGTRPDGSSGGGGGGAPAGPAGGGSTGGLVPCGQGGPCQLEQIKELGRNIFNFLLGLGAVAATAAIVVGGFNYMKSQGDPKALAEAKQTVILAVIGLIILLLSFVIVNTILTALGTKSEFTQ